MHNPRIAGHVCPLSHGAWACLHTPWTHYKLWQEERVGMAKVGGYEDGLPLIAEEALLALSFSLSLPVLLLLALANPRCKVECQEWGRDFLMLALAVAREKKEPPPWSSSSTAPLLTSALSVSARGVPSLALPSARLKLRENMSMLVFQARGPAPAPGDRNLPLMSAHPCWLEICHNPDTDTHCYGLHNHCI